VELVKTLKCASVAATASEGARRHALNCLVEKHRSMLSAGGF
jgi:hypothetical protein